MTSEEISQLADRVYDSVDVSVHFSQNRDPYDVADAILNEAVHESGHIDTDVSRLSEKDREVLMDYLQEHVFAGIS